MLFMVWFATGGPQGALVAYVSDIVPLGLEEILPAWEKPGTNLYVLTVGGKENG